MSPTPSLTPPAGSPGSKARTAAAGDLAAALHRDLRLMARRHLAREYTQDALEPTSLVHEAYLRLARQRSLDCRNEQQFLALASTCMRRVLVDDARRRHAAKRPQCPVDAVIEGCRVEQPSLERTLSVRGALRELRARAARQALVVELRFFEGLSLDEVAARLQISPATVKRELQGGLQFLRRRLSPLRAA